MLNDPSQYHHGLIRRLGIKNQKLIGAYLNLGLHQEIASLKAVDSHLYQLLQTKMPASTHYIWRSQQDDKVRGSHAENNGRIFAWDNRPSTGHPGEEFNCRCWAEPINASEYANQTLISSVSDNPDRWTNVELLAHFLNGGGSGVSLQEIGYLDSIILHYSETLGIYNRVNQQIIADAVSKGEGSFVYDFNNSYNFRDVLFTFRNSTVSGVFIGDARQERGHLVINGIVTYDFFDEFSDPLSFVEIRVLLGENRQDAEAAVRGFANATGDIYPITDRWQTTFNATVQTPL